MNHRPRRGPWRSPEEHRKETAAFTEATTPPGPIAFVSKADFARVLRGLGFPSYQEYLLSPKWFAIRSRVLKRAKNRCAYCGGRAWQVHHELYTKENLSGDSLEGLAATCSSCHERQHGLRPVLN